MNRYKYIIALLLIVHLAALFLFVFMRLADADEGFYMNAARMVNQGMSVYTDFFYTQLLMMPTIFAPFAAGGWGSFFALRIFAALAGFLSAILLAVIVLKTTLNYKATVIALGMFVFSGMMIAWNTTFKPLAFCNLLSIGTFFFWLLYYEKRRMTYLIMTGLFLSALVNFRSVFVVLLPLYLLSVFYLSKKEWAKNLIIFVLSLVPFALPTFMAILRSPGNFWAGNIFFQLHRDPSNSLGFVLQNHLVTLGRAIIDPHLLIIAVLTVISIIVLFKRNRINSAKNILTRPEGMAVMNLILIAGVYMLPHPIARQYINQYLPFAIITIAFSLNQMLESIGKYLKPLARKIFLYGLAAAYILSLIPYTIIFIYGVRKDDRYYLISEMKKISHQMLQLTNRDSIVLSEWPGYTFLTGQTPLRYTEIVSCPFDLPLKHDEYMKYKLCDEEYLENEVKKGTPDLVVTVNRPAAYYAAALGDNYDGVFNSNDVSIYKRK